MKKVAQHIILKKKGSNTGGKLISYDTSAQVRA